MSEENNTLELEENNDALGLEEVTKQINKEIGDAIRITNTLAKAKGFKITISRDIHPSMGDVGSMHISADEQTATESEPWAPMLIASKLLYKAAMKSIKEMHPNINEDQMLNTFISFMAGDSEEIKILNNTEGE